MKSRQPHLFVQGICWLLLLVLCPVGNESLAQRIEPVGFKPLFNGTDLTGWEGDERYWRVEAGVITAESTAAVPCTKNSFLRWADGLVDDFELKLKFKISGSPEANSGIQFRSQVSEDGHVVGYQADIDLAGKWLGTIYDEHGRAVLAARGQSSTVNGPKEIQHTSLGDAGELLKSANLSDWNEYHIIAQGNELTLKINGQVMSRVIDNDQANRDFSGVLALQLHSGPPMKVQFKDIQLKRLPLKDRTKIVFVAGTRSHAYFAHEHNAGCLLLAHSLNQSGLPVETAVYLNGWPRDVTAFDNADTVVFYNDGGARHVLNPHLAEFDRVMQRGTGVVCLHYAVETVPGPEGEHFKKWLGGYFEPHWSVNPHWTAYFDNLPEHPITNGVRPFSILDEWYYHMRFVDGMKGVTPILSDLPPRETMSRPDGPHSGNPHVRDAVLVRKEPQHVGWAYDRDDGGRGFGFTGGHFHINWQQDDFRKLVLNAILWTAKQDVPESGVVSPTPTQDQMEANQDYPKPANWNFEPPKTGTKRPQPEPSEKPENRQESTSVESAPSQSRDLSHATSQLKVAEGLEIKLFSGEPDLSNPISMDIDARGRIWVTEGVNYRRFRNTDTVPRPEGDRILILEDTNRDGVSDLIKVFYQGPDIDSAHGICVLGNRALVSCGDSIFWLIDEDGDDKADRKEILFTGIQGVQHDHGVHSCTFGPDGKLYFNFGNYGVEIKDRNGNPIVDRQGNVVNSSRKPYQEGMAFRCNLDGSQFETLAWNFRNNWELCVDSFGGIWQSDNDDDGNQATRINYVMEFGNYGYKDELTGAGWRDQRTGMEEEIPRRHWHQNDPGSIPNLLLTGAGSPSGILIYEGNLLPAPFRNQLIHCEPGQNVVRAYPVQNSGAGYSAEILDLVSGEKDQWFRPSDVCVAPDGSLFIADWYDAGVGGHRMVDAKQGRIFRVSPPGKKYEFPEVDVSTAEGAISALKSPNLATRYLGWTALQKLGQKSEPALEKLSRSENLREQARAFWLLGKGNLGPFTKQKHLKRALSHSAPEIRMLGLRLLRQIHKEIDVTEVVSGMSPYDSSPQVRREMLIALRDFNRRETPVIWTELALQYDGHDRWYLEALGIAAEPPLGCLSGNLARSNRKVLGEPRKRDIIWRSRSKKTPEYLAEIILSPSTPVEEIPRYFRALDFNGPLSDELLTRIAFDPGNETHPAGPMITFESLRRTSGAEFLKNKENAASLERLLERILGTPEYVSLVSKFQLSSHYPALIRLAVESSGEQLGVDACRVLVQNSQWELLEQQIKSMVVPASIQLVASLGQTEDARAIDLLIKILQNSELHLEVSRAAVKSAARTRPGAEKLIQLAKQDSLEPGLHPALAAALHASSWSEARKIADQMFPLAPSKDEKPLPPISELVKQKGDPHNGRFVYHNHGTCAKCHQVNGLGRPIGPDLSEVGKKLSRYALFESILYPSAGVSHNYETYVLVTVDGNILTGLLVSQSETETSLKNQDGIVRTVPKNEIEELVKQEVSMMPADLHKLMSEQDLVDVVEFMTTLQKAKK